MTLTPLLLLACNRMACVEIDPVDPTDDTDPIDTSEPTDSGDGGGGTEPTPGLPCDQPEREPNNPYSNAQALPMEQWACGTFDKGDLSEIFLVQTTEIGWVRVWSRAYAVGSLADLTLALSSSDGPYGASKLQDPESTDATIVFPIDETPSLYITLSEHYGRTGDAYFWELMVSSVKAPTEWTSQEGSSNDTRATAEPITSGDRRFGRIDSATDYDWYSLEVGEGVHDVTIDIDAFQYDSPADVMVELYDPSGTYYRKDSSSNESGTYNADPLLSATLTTAGTWTFKVQPETDSSGSSLAGGGKAFWYVVEPTLVPREE